MSIIQKKSEDRTKTPSISTNCRYLHLVLLLQHDFFTIFRLLKRLEKIRYFAKALGNGDLSTKSDIAGSNELGIIGYHLDEMVKNLAGMFQTTKKWKFRSWKKLRQTFRSVYIYGRKSSVMVSKTSGKVLSLAEKMQTNMHSVSME